MGSSNPEIPKIDSLTSPPCGARHLKPTQASAASAAPRVRVEEAAVKRNCISIAVGSLTQLSRSGRRKISRRGVQHAAPIACRIA
jgi:hypothetical protein